jgi:hypothetical protein
MKNAIFSLLSVLSLFAVSSALAFNGDTVELYSGESRKISGVVVRCEATSPVIIATVPAELINAYCECVPVQKPLFRFMVQYELVKTHVYSDGRKDIARIKSFGAESWCSSALEEREDCHN